MNFVSNCRKRTDQKREVSAHKMIKVCEMSPANVPIGTIRSEGHRHLINSFIK